jgi:ribulose-bisphosphate carboxylase large chain
MRRAAGPSRARILAAVLAPVCARRRGLLELLRVIYHLDVPGSEAEARAEALAREQTVEVPREALRDEVVVREALGRVERVEEDPAGGFRATLAYPVAATGLDPAQCLNVVFGNSSLHEDVRCLEVEPGPELAAALGGPRFGLAGLRKKVGVFERPLTCTAVKPMGLGTAALAELAGTFARAGIDVVKDDHGLADQTWSPFRERVRACLAAVARAADATGHDTVYAPNLIGTPARVRDALRFAEDAGARAVLASPMLLGLPAFFELCRCASVPVIAHPAFAGVLRIAPEALFGTLLRLFGADAVIFISFGSRFRRSEAECRRVAERLRGPLARCLPSLPVPAGGIELENAAEMVRCYGRDAMLLVGGSLQREAGAILERGRRFVAVVHEAAAGLS